MSEPRVTELLERAFHEAAKLPPGDQDAVAAWLLAELESERRWEESFARSQDLLERLADEALAEERAGLTKPLNLNRLYERTVRNVACPPQRLG